MATTVMTGREQAILDSLASLIGRNEAEKARKGETVLELENSEWI